MELIRFEKQVPEKFLKHLKGTEGIYEIRIRTMKGSLRILSFFDNGSLIVLVNCFIKKCPNCKIELESTIKGLSEQEMMMPVIDSASGDRRQKR